MDWVIFNKSINLYNVRLKATIKIDSQYNNLKPYFLQLDKLFKHTGTTIYKDRNEIKVMEWEGLLVNVKKYATPHIINRLIYTTIRKPKAVRAYNNALMLRSKDILTPEPIGYRLEQDHSLLGHSYLVTRHLSFMDSLFDLDMNHNQRVEEIASALGVFAAKLHELELLHLDFSSGNVLYTFDEDGSISFSIVDLNRMRFGPVSIKRGCASFQRLYGDTVFLSNLAESYANSRQYKNVDEVKKWTQKYHHKYWKSRSIQKFKNHYK